MGILCQKVYVNFWAVPCVCPFLIFNNTLYLEDHEKLDEILASEKVDYSKLRVVDRLSQSNNGVFNLHKRLKGLKKKTQEKVLVIPILFLLLIVLYSFFCFPLALRARVGAGAIACASEAEGVPTAQTGTTQLRLHGPGHHRVSVILELSTVLYSYPPPLSQHLDSFSHHTQKETVAKSLASVQNQISIIANMFVSVFAMFGVGYYIGERLFDSFLNTNLVSC